MVQLPIMLHHLSWIQGFEVEMYLIAVQSDVATAKEIDLFIAHSNILYVQRYKLTDLVSN